MRLLSWVLLLLAWFFGACGGAIAPHTCEPPAAFLSCDQAESDGTPRCWSEDTTDWLLYPDGHYIHETRISQGASGPWIIHTLCEGPAR